MIDAGVRSPPAQKRTAGAYTGAGMKRDALPLPVSTRVEHADHAWRKALPVLVIALVWVAGWFAVTGRAMVDTWAHTETYAHGFVVAPISLWLVWRMRDRLRDMVPRPSWPAVLLVGGAGFGWLLGQFGAVNALSQASFVAMLVLTVPAVVGFRIARALMFPLGFLFFAVPIGDFLLPSLMERTADFTVAALRLTGVPVYREGMLMVIPSGRWSIVEACSGVRYLIASLMVGTLFAYLNYKAAWRRFAFVGVAILVPIVANWVRAYIIVMLGHLSNNRIATGVDHVIYGWVFFGIVMLLMFWIGARWKENSSAVDARVAVAADAPGTAGEDAPRVTAADAPRVTAADAAGRPHSPAAIFWRALPAVIAATLVWPLVQSATARAIDAAPVVLAPVVVAGWQRAAGDAIAFVPQYKEPSASLHETLRRDDAVVGIYVAYYRAQDARRKLVSSENVLVHSEDFTWRMMGSIARQVMLGSAPHAVVATELRGPNEQAVTAWQWYWIDGTITASSAHAKALTAWSRLRGRGDDSAAIVLYAPDGNSSRAAATLQAFTNDAWPAIAGVLERAAQRK
jgi:exosortase A